VISNFMLSAFFTMPLYFRFNLFVGLVFNLFLFIYLFKIRLEKIQ